MTLVASLMSFFSHLNSQAWGFFRNSKSNLRKSTILISTSRSGTAGDYLFIPQLISFRKINFAGALSVYARINPVSVLCKTLVSIEA